MWGNYFSGLLQNKNRLKESLYCTGKRNVDFHDHHDIHNSSLGNQCDIRPKMEMKKILINIMRPMVFFGITVGAFPALAWDGYDNEKGSYVEIEKGNLVRSGQEIEIYEYSTGEYKDVEVESVRSSGSGVELEVYDLESGNYRTLDMDR